MLIRVERARVGSICLFYFGFSDAVEREWTHVGTESIDPAAGWSAGPVENGDAGGGLKHERSIWPTEECA